MKPQALQFNLVTGLFEIRYKHLCRRSCRLHLSNCLMGARVTLIVPASQPGWEEMENLKGNLKTIERKFERK